MDRMTKPEKIILHHSFTDDAETLSWGAIRRYHTRPRPYGNGWLDIGYHFGVEYYADRFGGEYEVLLGRMPHETGAHTLGENDRSWGICFVGNFDKAPVPTEQWDVGLRLVTGLLQMASLSTDDVYGHRDFAGKSCPGKYFDVDLFRQDLKKMQAGL